MTYNSAASVTEETTNTNHMRRNSFYDKNSFFGKTMILIIRHRKKVLLALPYKSLRCGHGAWAYPSTFYKKYINPLASSNQISTPNAVDCILHTLFSDIEFTTSDYKLQTYPALNYTMVCQITLDPSKSFPVHRSMSLLRKYLREAERMVPSFVDFKWVNAQEVSGWCGEDRIKLERRKSSNNKSTNNYPGDRSYGYKKNFYKGRNSYHNNSWRDNYYGREKDN